MSSSERGERRLRGTTGGTHLYCLGALVADEASRDGFGEFARSLEVALGALLSGLPRQDQAEALRLSYEMALHGEEPAPPRLRLVSSRD